MEKLILDGEIKDLQKLLKELLDESLKKDEAEKDETKRMQQRAGHPELVQDR